MAKISPADIRRIANEVTEMVLEYLRDSIVAEGREPTLEEAEALIWCLAGSIGMLEGYLKVNLPQPYMHNVRAFLDQLSSSVGERIAAVDQKISLDNQPESPTMGD